MRLEKGRPSRPRRHIQAARVGLSGEHAGTRDHKESYVFPVWLGDC
jgi:hypothetical protein